MRYGDWNVGLNRFTRIGFDDLDYAGVIWFNRCGVAIDRGLDLRVGRYGK